MFYRLNDCKFWRSFRTHIVDTMEDPFYEVCFCLFFDSRKCLKFTSNTSFLDCKLIPYSEISLLWRNRKTTIQYETKTAQRILNNAKQKHAKVRERPETSLSSNDLLLLLMEQETKEIEKIEKQKKASKNKCHRVRRRS